MFYTNFICNNDSIGYQKIRKKEKKKEICMRMTND